MLQIPINQDLIIDKHVIDDNAFCTQKALWHVHARFSSYHLFNCLPLCLPSLLHATPPLSFPFPPVFASIRIPAFLLLSFSLPPSTKSPGHQSYVVSGPPEGHALLHLAQLPLADPQGPGPDTAAAHAGRLPLLTPWLPGQEDAGGLMSW